VISWFLKSFCFQMQQAPLRLGKNWKMKNKNKKGTSMVAGENKMLNMEAMLDAPPRAG
jgi:hypothetical protein